MKSKSLLLLVGLATVIAFSGCHTAPEISANSTSEKMTGGEVFPKPRFKAENRPSPPPQLLFITVSPDYLADRVDFFATNGVGGIMMNNLMLNWSDDIWRQPSPYTPGDPAGRVVGPANPLFQKCRRANELCAARGMRFNSVKIAFYRWLPDWFDDPGWAQLAENFRQAAVFARDAKFGGIALDVEYIAEIYAFNHTNYTRAGYPRERLRPQALQRGREMMTAMLNEFPDMVFWLLPEAMSRNDWLANPLLAGMVQVMAERDAPGGFHLCTEGTYLQTRPQSLLWSVDRTNLGIRRTLDEARDPRVYEYWRRRCSVATGLWPLGYYREVYAKDGRLLGYTGRNEKFHGKLVGSMADKSENYSASDFRRALGAARVLSRSFVWIYCHGQIFWQMTPAEAKRYQAGENDQLPTVANIQDYLRVMREKRLLDDKDFARNAVALAELKELPPLPGFAPAWQIAGPFPQSDKGFDESYEPERKVSLDAAYGPFSFAGSASPVQPRWSQVRPDGKGYVDLRRPYGSPPSPIAYAVARVNSKHRQNVFLRLGTNDYGAVFVNGRRVYHFEQMRSATPDDDNIEVELPAGRSEILVKVGDAGGAGWGFYLRVTDRNGNWPGGVTWEPAG